MTSSRVLPFLIFICFGFVCLILLKLIILLCKTYWKDTFNQLALRMILKLYNYTQIFLNRSQEWFTVVGKCWSERSAWDRGANLGRPLFLFRSWKITALLWQITMVLQQITAPLWQITALLRQITVFLWKITTLLWSLSLRRVVLGSWNFAWAPQSQKY